MCKEALIKTEELTPREWTLLLKAVKSLYVTVQDEISNVREINTSLSKEDLNSLRSKLETEIEAIETKIQNNLHLLAVKNVLVTSGAIKIPEEKQLFPSFAPTDSALDHIYPNNGFAPLVPVPKNSPSDNQSKKLGEYIDARLRESIRPLTPEEKKKVNSSIFVRQSRLNPNGKTMKKEAITKIGRKPAKKISSKKK
jgi:hypothetical protein